MDDRLSVSYAVTDEEKEPVVFFVNEIYRKIYGTLPPVADVYAVAWQGETMQGCIGIEFPRNGELPIEAMYGLKNLKLPLPLTPENGVQFSRWVSIARNVSGIVMYASVVYALARNKTCGLVEHDFKVHRRAAQLGIEFLEIPGAELNLSAVPEGNRAYYSRKCMKPYLVDLRQARDALAKHINPDQVTFPFPP